MVVTTRQGEQTVSSCLGRKAIVHEGVSTATEYNALGLIELKDHWQSWSYDGICYRFAVLRQC